MLFFRTLQDKKISTKMKNYKISTKWILGKYVKMQVL